jgi:protein ImuB
MQCWVSAQNTIKSIANNSRPACAGAVNDLKNEARTEALYPTWLLPEPLQLATVGNSPVYQGRLVRLAGPQRLEATGWLLDSDAAGQRGKPPAIRDYFIYRSLQAGLLWIYTERLVVATPPSASEPLRAWYLHGFFA